MVVRTDGTVGEWEPGSNREVQVAACLPSLAAGTKPHASLAHGT